MKNLKSFVRSYFAAFGLISLPFFILLILSFLFLVNQEVIVYGLTFSFLSSFVIAYNFRQYEQSITFTNQNLFINNLISSLLKLGYLVKDKTAGSIVFEPTVHAHLFGGNILLHIADNFATIEGSRLPVRKGVALTLNKNKRALVQSTYSMEECINVWANDVNCTEFEQAEEIMPEIKPEISVKKPEKD